MILRGKIINTENNPIRRISKAVAELIKPINLVDGFKAFRASTDGPFTGMPRASAEIETRSRWNNAVETTPKP